MAANVWIGIAAHDPAQRAAEDLAAGAWAADRSFFLVNGSSSGTHGFLLATLGPGDEVVVARDVHQSVIAGRQLHRVTKDIFLLLRKTRPGRLCTDWPLFL